MMRAAQITAEQLIADRAELNFVVCSLIDLYADERRQATTVPWALELLRVSRGFAPRTI